MTSWDGFTAAAPDLARFGLALLTRLGDPIGYLSTIRHDDGGPRVHPVCPFIGEGRLYITIPRSSPKRLDLRADPRYMFHAFPDDKDAEFSIRGTARLVTEPSERAIAAAACPFATGVQIDDDVFELGVDRADSTTWMNWAQADTYPERERWDAR
jgi:hypothetical protein